MRSHSASKCERFGGKRRTLQNKSTAFYHLDLEDEEVYLDVQVDEQTNFVRFYGVDYSMQCMDLLLHICTALHLNVGDYLILVPAESLTGDGHNSWRCAPSSSKLSDWMEIPTITKLSNNSSSGYVRLVPRNRVRRFAKFDNCYTYVSSGPKNSNTVVKSGREFLKDLGQRIVIYLPRDRKVVTRSQLDVPIMDVLQQVTDERNLNLNSLCLVNVRTGEPLDSTKTFREENITEFELRECQPGQSNVHLPEKFMTTKSTHKPLASSKSRATTLVQSFDQSPISASSLNWPRSTISSMISIKADSEKLSIFDGATVNSEYHILSTVGTLTRNYKKRVAPLPPPEERISSEPITIKCTINPERVERLEKVLRPRLPQNLTISSINANTNNTGNHSNAVSNIHLENIKPESSANESSECRIEPDQSNLVSCSQDCTSQTDANSTFRQPSRITNRSETILWTVEELQTSISVDDYQQFTNTNKNSDHTTMHHYDQSCKSELQQPNLVYPDFEGGTLTTEPLSDASKESIEEVIEQHSSDMERSTCLVQQKFSECTNKPNVVKLSCAKSAISASEMATAPQSQLSSSKKHPHVNTQNVKMSDFMDELKAALSKLRRKSHSENNNFDVSDKDNLSRGKPMDEFIPSTIV